MWDAEGRYYPDETKKPLLKNEVKRDQHDPNFRGVVTEGRKFNDVLFGILFVFMFIGMGVVNTVGFVKGDPSKLVPSSEYDVYNATAKAEFWFQDSVAHLKRDVDILGGSLGVAFLLGLVWIQLMRVFTRLFIYLTVVLGIASVIAGGVYSLILGMNQNQESLQIFSYCLFGLAFLLLVAVIFLRKKINLTAELFNECCRGVQHNPALFVSATIMFICITVFVAYWVMGFIFLFSIPGDSIDVQIPNQMPHFNTKIRNLMYYNLFGFFWTVALLSAAFQVSISGAVASWYFSRDIHEVKGSPALRSLGYAFTKSFGSLALGSLVVAIVEFLQFLVNKVKKTPTSNRVVKYIACLLQCFLSCIQGLVRFINRYAYICIAMHGEPFCTSSRGTFDLISRNSFSAVIVDTLAEFVLFVGKLLGTAATTIFSLFLLHVLHREISLVTVLSVVVVSFVVFSLFANIVAVGVDTVLVCYLEDLERNKGSNLFIEPTLHELLQEKQRQAAINS